MIAKLVSLYDTITLWVRWWWLVNVRRVTPGEMHKVLTGMGYTCQHVRIPTGCRRIYSFGNEKIEITIREVSG